MVVGFASAYTSPALVSMQNRNITSFEVSDHDVSIAFQKIYIDQVNIFMHLLFSDDLKKNQFYDRLKYSTLWSLWEQI